MLNIDLSQARQSGKPSRLVDLHPLHSELLYYAYTIANQNMARSKLLFALCKSGPSPTQNLGQVSPGRAQVSRSTLAWTKPRFSKTWAESGLVCVVWTRLYHGKLGVWSLPPWKFSCITLSTMSENAPSTNRRDEKSSV